MKRQYFIHEINAHFNLREPKNRKPTTVFMVVRINGRQLKLSTQMKVYPTQWDKRNQQAVISPSLSELDNKNNELLNQKILTYRERFNQFKIYISSHIKEIENQEQILLQFITKGQSKVKMNRQLHIIDTMIKAVLNNNTIKPSTKDSYLNELSKSSETSFTAFLKATNRTYITFYDINKVLLKQYETFLFNSFKKNGEYITNGAVENKMTKLIAILRQCSNLGLFDDAQISGYKKPRVEESDSGIFLTQDEVKRMEELNLTGKLELARDILVFLCHTGQRFSDLQAMKENGILIETEFGTSIRYISTKENNEVYAPLLGSAKKIFEKYQGVPTGEFAAVVTDVKEVGRLAHIDREVLKKEIRGGKIIVKKKKAYQLIGTHTGRRTFINNMLLLKNPTYLIMKVTGHKTESAFRKYVGISSEEASKIFLKNENKKGIIPSVDKEPKPVKHPKKLYT